MRTVAVVLVAGVTGVWIGRLLVDRQLRRLVAGIDADTGAFSGDKVLVRNSIEGARARAMSNFSLWF